MLKKRKTSRKSRFVKIINSNIDAVRDFIFSKISVEDIRKTSYENKYKITIRCPYCGMFDNRKKYKLVINLDWGNFKCFKCGTSGSIMKLLQHLNAADEFSSLLSSLSNITAFDLKSLIKSDSVISVFSPDREKDEVVKEIEQFIKDRGLVSVDKIKEAKKYALKRTFNNKNEIESYLADDRYIYVPIIMHEKIYAYMGRRYVEDENIPRYYHKIFIRDEPLIGFLDEVTSNVTTNDLYITEGYFDAYSINYAMTNYVAVCIFGKNKKYTIPKLPKYFSNDTNIYLTLDSITKDPNIIEDNLVLGEELSKYFTNVYIVDLKEGDPSDIMKTKGSLYLRKVLKNNVIPFIKYKIIHTALNRRKQLLVIGGK